MMLSGIVQTAFQSEPYPILWAVRADGQLLGLVFNRQDEVYAWFRVSMRCAAIESVAVISGQGQEDQVAISVNRIVGGNSVRYVEYFMPQELFNDLANGFFVNSGTRLKFADAVDITNITNGNPPVVTATRQNFANGDLVQISGVLGMTEINQDKTQAYTVANSNIAAGTFELATMNTTGFGAYLAGGSVMQVTNTINGMSYLLGRLVTAVGDGMLILPSSLVTSDSITFPYYCNQIVIGLPYTMMVQPTNPVITAPTHTTRGLRQKLDRTSISLYQSMGGQYGTDLNHMYDITYGIIDPGTLPTMATLEIQRDLDADWLNESTFYITQSDPFPFTLRGLVMDMSYNLD